MNASSGFHHSALEIEILDDLQHDLSIARRVEVEHDEGLRHDHADVVEILDLSPALSTDTILELVHRLLVAVEEDIFTIHHSHLLSESFRSAR